MEKPCSCFPAPAAANQQSSNLRWALLNRTPGRFCIEGEDITGHDIGQRADDGRERAHRAAREQPEEGDEGARGPGGGPGARTIAPATAGASSMLSATASHPRRSLGAPLLRVNRQPRSGTPTKAQAPDRPPGVRLAPANPATHIKEHEAKREVVFDRVLD